MFWSFARNVFEGMGKGRREGEEGKEGGKGRKGWKGKRKGGSEKIIRRGDKKRMRHKSEGPAMDSPHGDLDNNQ